MSKLRVIWLNNEIKSTTFDKNIMKIKLLKVKLFKFN